MFEDFDVVFVGEGVVESDGGMEEFICCGLYVWWCFWFVEDEVWV